MTITRSNLLPGMRLRAIQTSKFKSSFYSIVFNTPLRKETAAMNALIPSVLRQGTINHPDMQSLAAALDELYGGAIEPVVRQRGETQSIGFVASFLDDAYTLDKSVIVEPASQLLVDILFCPLVEERAFSTDFVTREKENLIQKIRGQVNDKRYYANQRMIQHMCQNEAYGVERLGSLEEVEKITAKGLWDHYLQLLATSEIEIYYCGSASYDRVEWATNLILSGLPLRGEVVHCDCDVRITAPEEPHFVSQSMDVSQGKLSMGFRTGGVTAWEEDYPALIMVNAIFGGTSMSKLFMNVREKHSLCYYASSTIERLKGIMTVSSGIEFEKFDQAKTEILAQLEAVKKGDITTEEMEGSRRILIANLQTIPDSQGRMEDFWLGQAIAGLDEDVDTMVEKLEAVTVEQVVAVANKLQLDTIFFLKGLEE
ncbi:MAG: pitrilysin family protein [Eubacteriales bacterium]